jgi:hypothetical protein
MTLIELIFKDFQRFSKKNIKKYGSILFVQGRKWGTLDIVRYTNQNSTKNLFKSVECVTKSGRF